MSRLEVKTKYFVQKGQKVALNLMPEKAKFAEERGIFTKFL